MYSGQLDMIFECVCTWGMPPKWGEWLLVSGFGETLFTTKTICLKLGPTVPICDLALNCRCAGMAQVQDWSYQTGTLHLATLRSRLQNETVLNSSRMNQNTNQHGLTTYGPRLNVPLIQGSHQGGWGCWPWRTSHRRAASQRPWSWAWWPWHPPKTPKCWSPQSSSWRTLWSQGTGWCGTCPACPLETPRTSEGICHSWPGGWAMHPKRENIGVSWDLHHEKGCNSSKQLMKYDETTNHWPFPRSWACRSEPWFGSSSPQQGRHARGPSCLSNPFSGNLWRPHGNQYPINFIKMWNCSQRLGFAVRDFCLSEPSAWKITEILAPPWVPRPKENDNNNPSMSQQFAFTQAYHDFMPEFQSHWSALNA